MRKSDMSPGQVARALSLREFLALCAEIDKESPQGKFKVIKATRELGCVKVLVDLGRGTVEWFTIEGKKKER